MKEFLRKFGTKEKASDVLARIAEELRREEDASRLTPLQIPPRPETLTETPTCRAISAQKETPNSPSETLISEITPVIPSTQPESQSEIPTSVQEGDEREEEGGNRETEGDEGVGSAGNVNEGDREFGEEDIIGDKGSGDRTSEGVVVSLGGGNQSENVEGETPTDEGVEGEIPVDNDADGEESEGNVEEEILEELEAERREREIVDEDDVEDDETEKVDMDVDGYELSDRPELVEGTKFIVVPDEGPEAEDTPATARENRRNARRSKKLEGTRASTSD